MALYQVHRPQHFSDLLGQEGVTETLKSQLATGKFSHAYLFTGPRGTGKTTTARLIAKALNCTNPKDGEPCGKCESCVAVAEGRNLDVIEIDAASNRGIEEIRDLREKIKLAPTQGKYKVYVIDEVHMLTNEAFNALLKTLEEPPAHAVFILCTTEAHKVPVTILSRCQKFEFSLAGKMELETLLKKVAKKESLEVDKDSLTALAEAADGSYRDALTILEQVSSSGKVGVEDIRQTTRRSGQEKKLLELVEAENAIESIKLINDLHQAGANLISLTADLVALMRIELLQAVESRNDVRQLKLVQLLRLFSKAHLELKQAVLPTLPLELAIIEGVGTKAKIVQQVVAEITEEETVVIASAQDKEEVQNIAPVASPSLDLLKKNWELVLKQVKPLNHSLEAFLRGCEPNEVTDKAVTLKFFYKFHKDMVDQGKNRSLVEQEISKVMGQPLRIKTILGEKTGGRKVLVDEVENVEEVPNEELVEKAVDIFNSGIQ